MDLLSNSEFEERVMTFVTELTHEFFKRDGVLSEFQEGTLEDLQKGITNILNMSRSNYEYQTLRTQWLEETQS